MFECVKCKSDDFEIIIEGNQKGLYCASCGRWQKWLGKDEYRKYTILKNRKENK